jgi:hypothetical protein
MTPPQPIGLDPNCPVTGGKSRDRSRAMNKIVAAKTTRLAQIYIPYQPHTDFHFTCDLLLQMAAASGDQPKKGARLIAPSGSGKTAAALTFIEAMNASATGDERPAILVRLDSVTTPKMLIQAVLLAYGDENSNHGTELLLRARLRECFRRFRTLILFIDEIQHLQRYPRGGDVTDYLKRFLDDGVVAVVFMGTEEAELLFERNLQLNSRLLSPCTIAPLDRASANDRALLMKWLLDMDDAIVAAGILPRHSGFAHPWIRGCLHEVSAGIFGRVARIFGIALEIALSRKADCIEVFDLALAVDEWAVRQKFVTANPFRGTAP